jgi:hypothetical protein
LLRRIAVPARTVGRIGVRCVLEARYMTLETTASMSDDPIGKLPAVSRL